MIHSDSSDNESSEEDSVGTSGFSDEQFDLFEYSVLLFFM